MNLKIYKIASIQTNEFLNKKNSFMIFLLIFFICSIQLFVYKPYFNFWTNLYYSLGDNLINSLFFCLIIFNTVFFIRGKKVDTYLFNRIGSYSDKLKYNLYCIINTNSIIFLCFLILNLSFSVFSSHNDYSIILDNYGVILPIRIIIEIVKYYIYVVLISSLINLLTNIKNNYISIISFILVLLITIIPVSNKQNIENIFDTSIQYIFYLNHIKFSTMTMDILYTIINISIFLIINIFLYKCISNKKEDAI